VGLRLVSGNWAVGGINRSGCVCSWTGFLSTVVIGIRHVVGDGDRGLEMETGGW
jgi:hypothetical protein